MIFISAGTTEHEFGEMDGLVKQAMRRIDEEAKSEQVIYQNRNTRLKTQNNLQIVGELEYDQLVENIKQARLVICHGGPATIFLALKLAKNLPLIVPRGYKSHVDDHQWHFANWLKRQYPKLTVIDDAQLSKDDLMNPMVNNLHNVSEIRLGRLIEKLNLLELDKS